MAILGTKKNTKVKADKTKSGGIVVAKKDSAISSFSLSGSVILKPRITEKSGDLSQTSNAYTFEINPSSSKNEVAKAVKSLYKVVPTKINIINLPRKRVFSRGKKGWSGGVKKAVVYLKKEEKIEFI